MKIVTVAQMVAMEQATDAAGFSYDQMMAAAGGAVARIVWEYEPFAGTILCLIGPGNNGGDGLVACAALQAEGMPVVPYIWKRKSEHDPLLGAVHNSVWAEQDAGYSQLRKLVAEAGIVIDALLGTGNVRPITGDLADLLAVVRQALDQRNAAPPILIHPAYPHPRTRAQARALVIACDCPSGLNCDTGEIDPLALPADHTVTFALPKAGHFLQPGAAACGRLTIADIQIDRRLAPANAPDLLTPNEVATLLPTRPANAHKGTFGKALIVAGSNNYPGAAAIASLAAYRAGAGLVHLASAAAVGNIVASQLAEPIHTTLPAELGALLPEAADILRPLLAAHDALLLGPGLGLDHHTIGFVTAFLLNRPRVRLGFLAERTAAATSDAPLPPLVVDADALNALAQTRTSPAVLPPGSILTPHPGEFARLTGLSSDEINANRWQVARRFAREWNQIVVLKGAFTVIAHPDGSLAISPFANAALATAGSGDVLAGALVALLAQGLNPWDAARVGVYLHALAGRLASEKCGPALLATDIAHALSSARRLLDEGR